MTGSRGGLNLLVVARDHSFGSAVVEGVEAAGATAYQEYAKVERGTQTQNQMRTVDGAIVDGHIETPTTVVEQLAGEHNLPVVVLADSKENDDTITGTLEVGAIDVFPRTISSAQYELILERIDNDISDSETPEERTAAKQVDWFEQIFGNVNDIIAIHDRTTGELRNVNQRLCELTGYDKERVLELGAEGLVQQHPDQEYGPQDIPAIIDRVMCGEDIDPYEQALETSDGDLLWVEVNPTRAVIRGKQRFLAISRDITERKRREQMIRNLHAATERLQKVETAKAACQATVQATQMTLNLPLASIWLHDESDDGPVLEHVAATDSLRDADLSRFSPGDVEYEAFRHGEVRVDDPSDQFSGEQLDTMLTLPIGEHGLLLAGKNGVEEYNEYVHDAARVLVGHVRRVLDRIEREQTVRESEQRFRLIAERIDEVIYLAEPDFSEVLYVNPAYEEIYGRPVETVYDDPTSFREVVDKRDRDRFRENFRETLADLEEGHSDESYGFEFRVRQPDGEVRWVNVTGHLVELPGGDHRYVGIADDITERKHREQRLEVFNRILRHNLRNKLAVILGHAERLADQTTSDHAERIVATVNDLAEIGTRARRTDRIISKDESPTEIDLAEFMERAIGSTRSNGTEVAVTTELPESGTLRTNEAPLSIAVESVLENAFEYATSAITVTVEERPDECLITIADDGSGIPAEELVPIETGSESDLEHGIGLGLWELRWSVDALNGELAFDTEDGTTVMITVPEQREAINDD